MRELEPSRTAMAAADHRAAHQVLERGRIFTDPLAIAVLGQDAETVVKDAEAHPSRRGMRHFIAARSHFAEETLSHGVETRGVRQVAVLGAGLDTFAYRNPHGKRVQVFEVDHPATQAWKRRRLAEAGIAVPNTLVFAPVDFERQELFAALQAVGFDPGMRTFFFWLGVVPYLTEGAVRATLEAIGALPGGAEVVFDYGDPPGTISPDRHAVYQARAARVAALGEPWLSYFEPADLEAMLHRLGFTQVEDLGPSALAARYWPSAARAASERGGHVVFAATNYARRILA